MDFLTAQKEVSEALGLDITNTSTATKVKRWLNLSYQNIVGNYNWSWLKDYTTVTLKIDYTSGTVSVGIGGSTLTFDAVISESQTGRFIQFTTSRAWYKITAHTAGTATATIDPVYAESTAITDGAFTIRSIYYSLPSTVEHVIGARQTTFPLALEVMDRTRYNEFVWWSNLVGATRAVIPSGLDSSGNWQFTPYPFPNQPYILEFYYLKRISDITGDTASPIFPRRFESIWVEGALCYGYRFLDDTRYENSFTLFGNTVRDMWSHDEPMQNHHWIVKPYDQIPANRGLMLPAEYGANQGNS